ncbi:MFS transporter [Sulfobacillus sp. hq2]|uniref:MFS transporter n=1 Tax=Sulfobacillus sp. hq2 TaxID=2039167 RepID=UPI000CD045DD|nr:MFS transporter [Sulfobacillus sp. hq2]POB09309.1 MFS transporter [Sulfobacillus sp. hq2]
MSDFAQTAPATIAARLDRLPPTHYFRRFVTLISMGGWFEFYDLFMAGYVGAALLSAKMFTLADLTLFISLGFAGMFVGTIGFGLISDLWGRKTVFTFSLILYSFFVALMALSPSVGWILAFRTLSGIGIGAQLVVIDTYITEVVPHNTRGKYIAFSQVITYTAVPVVAFLSYVLVPTHILLSGWRWVVLIGALGALIVWFIRLRIPESPRWYSLHGRVADADKAMSCIEQSVREELNAPLPAPLPALPEVASDNPFREIWQPAYRGRTIMMMIFQFFQTIGFYGFAAWVPTLLLKEGFTLLHSLFYTFLIAVINPVGPWFAMLVIERVQRKWLIVIESLSIGALGLLFAHVRSPLLIVLVGVGITLFNNAFSATFHAYQSELFPTRARSTGIGFTYSWSRLSSMLTAFLIAVVLQHYGVNGVFVTIGLAMAIVAITIGFFGPRTNNAQLEAISQ